MRFTDDGLELLKLAGASRSEQPAGKKRHGSGDVRSLMTEGWDMEDPMVGGCSSVPRHARL